MAKQKNTKKQKKSKTNLDGSAKSQAKFSKISNEKKEAIGNVVRELVAEEAIQIVLYLIGKTQTILIWKYTKQEISYTGYMSKAFFHLSGKRIK